MADTAVAATPAATSTDTGSVPDAGATPPGDASGTSASPVTPKPAAPKPEPRRVKVKIDGEEREVEEEELVRGFQSRAAVAKRFEEVARRAKEIEAKEAAAKKALDTPEVQALMQQYGVDAEDAAAILRVQKRMQAEQMSPDQRALAEERAKREASENEARTLKEQQAQARQNAEIEGHKVKINSEVIAAAEAVGLPKSPRVAQLMIGHMQTMAAAGLPFDAQESARYAMETVKAEATHIIGAMNDDQLEGFLGAETVKRILRRAVAKAKGLQQGPGVNPAPVLNRAPGNVPRPKLSVEEWRERHR